MLRGRACNDEPGVRALPGYSSRRSWTPTGLTRDALEPYVRRGLAGLGSIGSLSLSLRGGVTIDTAEANGDALVTTGLTGLGHTSSVVS